ALMRVSVKGDTIRMTQALEKMRDRAPLAVARALNRTIDSARTQATRSISEDLGGIRQADVRKGLETTRANQGRLEATLRVRGRRIPRIACRARQTRTGVSYKLPTGAGFVRSAFLATMRSGHTGVFRRIGTPRLPIVELKGPSLPRVFTQERVLSAVR